MFVFVVRYLSFGDGGGTDAGNMEICYADEHDAEKAMLEDMENVYNEWCKTAKDGMNIVKVIGEKNPNGCSDYGIVHDESGIYHGECGWWIDKLELKG